MIEVLLTILTLLTLIAVWALFQIKAKLAIDNNGPILREIKGLSENQGKVESLVKTEITTNRKEQADNAKALREEVGNNVKKPYRFYNQIFRRLGWCPKRTITKLW
jgi:hypothetical protein